MLKSGEKDKSKRKKFHLIKEPIEVFEKFKHFFTTALILIYYNPAQKTIVESNISSFIILVIIL